VFHSASGGQLDLNASKRDVNEHILRSVEHAARVFPDGSNLHAVISAWVGGSARCSTEVWARIGSRFRYRSVRWSSKTAWNRIPG
jgi:hypothetical protein